MAVENHLSAMRKKRGLGAAEVASAVGISRQTVYAIEAGSYVPNTLVALRLARLLEVTVEDLFLLEADTPPPADIREALFLPGDEQGAGDLLQLCQVDDQLIAVRPSLVQWTLPNADASCCDELSEGVEPGRARVRSFRDSAEYAKRLLIAGCDPGISIVTRHLRKDGVEAIIVSRNSSQSLELLRQGVVHVAGTHLPDTDGESHMTAIQKHFPPGSIAIFSYAVWEQGLVVAKGNPRAIFGIHDFSRKEVRIVNREPGAGSRILLDTHLTRLGMPTNLVNGYEQFAKGHLAAAAQVFGGVVDCCIATRAAARLYGLGFVPLSRERYDFVIRTKHLELPAAQALLETLGRAALRSELQEFGGYDTSIAGERLE
jgi:molybdate-binding protein/DNA-binding XRE family transcriptional regulator